MIIDIFAKGEVCWVDFGLIRNGSELTGKHFAVVFENNNSPRRDTVVCIPLSSRKDKPLRQNEVDLGRVINLTGKSSVALIHQITRISKSRIISRSFMTNDRKEVFFKLTFDQIKRIENALVKMLIGGEAA